MMAQSDPRDLGIIARFQREPDWFCEQVLGDTLWSKQREVLRALADNEKVAVASCHGVGKTWLASRAALWFLHSYAPAIVATTAPTGHQVRNLLWREIRTGHAALPPEFRDISKCLTTEIQFLARDGSVIPDHLAWGRSTDEAAAFQGVHGPHLMAIVDEAAGVADDIYEALDTWGAGGVYRELLIGNPTRSEGKFYRAFMNSELDYRRVQIPVTATPMWTDEEVPARVRKLLVQPERVEAWKADWGESSAAFQSRAYARFPDAGAESVVIPLGWLNQAKARGEEWKWSEGMTQQVGVDVARFGEDRTCTASRVGMALVDVESAQGDTTAPQVANMASEAAIRLRDKYGGPVLVVIDETGVGGGALDICLTRDDHRITYVGFQFGGKAIDAERRANAGAEAYWNLRDYTQANNEFPDLAIVPQYDSDGNPVYPAEVERFCAQVSSRLYDYDSKGRVKIEPKPKMKERQLPSPDEADAVAMAYASVPIETQDTVGMHDVFDGFQEDAWGAAQL